ncbi:hypothetical protein GXB81_18195 [Paraburkholderia sp. Ac-20336]|uniref:hypothetical protein n=1 Tax=Paraburkholderia sp. Ac-20336 TaxID=2703886 RepID=UPI00197EBB3D|nr:hypothetical protein [Paraburkholderia sp. Ac-20336]MBN3804967.1 hypothetical protein [Paraburkholderia sp. Ac-20336]
MTTMLIADMLADAEFDLSVADRSVSIALDKSVDVLKSAVPFQLPVRIVTCDLPARDIVLEDARELYSGVLLRWLAVFAEKPVLEGADLKDFIYLVRNVSSDKISRAFEQKRPVPPGLLRKRIRDECDICDAVMLRWLGNAEVKPLYELAVRCDLHCLQRNDQMSVLEELGLTDESMFDLPEEELIRLDLIARLEAENQRHLLEFWEFLGNDLIGIDIHHLLNDATANI